ncbi:MAG: RNA polymerase sigma factor [Acidimicrobiales bacterium]
MSIGAGERFAVVLGAARQGDQQALGELWQRYNHRLLRYLKGCGAADMAEDLASSTWIDVARGLPRFRGDEDGFRRWLFTIGRRRLTDELRRRTRRPESAMADPPESARAPLQPSSPAEDLEAALSLVRELSPDQAEAVLLRVVADLDVAAVAELMQRSEAAVRVLTHRGLKRLAELHSAPGPQPAAAPGSASASELGKPTTNRLSPVTTETAAAMKGAP